MTETRDNCFAASGEPMPLAEALGILEGRISPVTATETVTIADALGRTLAETVTSERDVPPHDNAAVDGYAVYSDDLSPNGGTRLPITGRIAAGHPLDRAARRGEALEIFTGAPLPEGPDTVVMQEDCSRDGDTVLFGPGVKRGANRRFRGEDIEAGTVILEPGIRLRPQDLGLAASVGRSEVLVRTPLRAAVFSTGDEVREPGKAIPAGCIFDSNRYVVGALLRESGCAVTDLGILPDDQNAISQALKDAAENHDLLITSGGVSVGAEDHVKAAVETLGSLHFWRLAIKPGRPIALGQVGDTSFIGLPGNPVAAMVTFLRIARPVVLLLAGRSDITPQTFSVRTAFAYRKKPGRREWLRAHLVRYAGGEPRAVKYASQGSGILTSLVAADGLVELPEHVEYVGDGDLVDFLPFSEVFR